MIELVNAVAQFWWQWMWQITLQSVILIALVLLVDSLTRKWLWPEVRLVLFLLVLVKLLLPPTFSLPSSVVAPLLSPVTPVFRSVTTSEPLSAAQGERPGFQSRFSAPSGAVVPVPQETQASDSHAINRAPRPVSSLPSLNWQSLLLLLWALGAVAGLVTAIVRNSEIRRRLLEIGPAIPKDLSQQVIRAAGIVGLNALPRVVLVRGLAGPAVWGVFRPTILLPEEELSRLSPEDLRNTLLHELAHVKRWDLLLQQIALGIQLIYWFHPLLWIVTRRLRHLRELCCDASVARLLTEEGVQSYRSTLLRASRQLLRQKPSEVSLGLMEDASQILERLRWLATKPWRFRRTRWTVMLALGAAMVSLVLPMARSTTGPDSFAVISKKVFIPLGEGQAYLYSFKLTLRSGDEGVRIFEATPGEDAASWTLSGPRLPDGEHWGYDCKAELKAGWRLAGEGSSLGYQTLIAARDSSLGYLEIHYAEDLQCTPLRMIRVESGGLWVEEPVRIKAGELQLKVFQDFKAAPVGLGERERSDRLKKAFPSVCETLSPSIEESRGSPGFDEYLRLSDETTANLFVNSEGETAPAEPVHYPYWYLPSGRFTPEGGLFLSGGGSREIHKCSSAGSVQESYSVGRQLLPRLMAVDGEGWPHVLLNEQREVGIGRWLVRFFHSPDDYADVPLHHVAEGFRPEAFGMDEEGNYYVLSGTPQGLTVMRFSPGGELEVEVSSTQVGRPVVSRILGAPMAVLPGGDVYVINRSTSPNQGDSLPVFSGTLYRTDFQNHSLEEVPLVPPLDMKQLTGIHPAGDLLSLEWGDYSLRTSMPTATVAGRTSGSRPSMLSRFTELQFFDGTAQIPRGRIKGWVVASTAEQILLQGSGRDADMPWLYLVRLSR